MKALTYTCLILISISTFSLKAQTKLQPSEAQIDSLFGDWSDDTKPGIALAVLNDGNIQMNKQWGLANLEHQIPIKDNSVFKFPGMADQIIAFCALLLEERGELKMTDPITAHLPLLPSRFQNISILQLLNHCSQLNSLSVLKEISGTKDTEASTLKELYYFLELKLSTSENTTEEHNFNRTGIRIVQMIIEKLSGKNLNDFAQIEIFEPLGMNSSLIANEATIIPNLAQGYQNKADEFRPIHESQNYLSCDQLYTTTTDLCLWVNNFWRPQIGSKSIWQKMDNYVLEKGEPVKQENQALFFGQHRYWNYQGEAKYYQIGVTAGYAAKVIRYPIHDLAVVVLGNFGRYNGHLASLCSSLYLKEYFENEPASVDKPKSKTLNSKELINNCGQYWDYKDESMAEVTLENDTLRYFDEKYNWKTNLIPIENDKFFIDVRDGYYVSFEKNSSDRELIFNNPKQEKVHFKRYTVDEQWIQHTGELSGGYINEQMDAHYIIKIENEHLLLDHHYQEAIRFDAMGQDEFKSTNTSFSRIKFERNDNDRIVGFKLSNPNFKDLFFSKQK